MAAFTEVDSRVNADRPPMEAALKAAKLVHSVRTFPGVNHASLTIPVLDTTQRRQVQRVGSVDWFGRYLKA
jgi:hypothetical protein